MLFIISIGNMLSTGIDQYFVFANAMNKEWIETFDFYVYNLGIGGGKISYGVGVERTFPVHSPVVDKIEVVTRGDVRRAKLYYLRNLSGKAAKVKEK